jgi:hypothetical protein
MGIPNHQILSVNRQGPPVRHVTDITGLMARWIASDLDASLSNGADVVSWTDHSGNGWTATNPNASGSRPTFVKPASGINGRSAVQSNNQRAMRTTSGLSFGRFSPYTFVIVFQITGTAPTGETGLFGVATGNLDGFRTGMAGSNQWEYTVPSVGNFMTPINTLSVNTWNYMMMVHDSTATPKIAIYLNDPTTQIPWQPGSAPTDTQGQNTASIFYFGSSGFQNSNNQVAECMIFSQALNATDRGVIQVYCQDTYGLL